MRRQLIRIGFGFIALMLLARAPRSIAIESNAPALSASTADAMAQAASPQAIAEYRYKLREYQEARATFEAEAGAYWGSIADKRRARNAKRRDHQRHHKGSPAGESVRGLPVRYRGGTPPLTMPD